jgi:uncharacterized protein (TIGR03067 family)
MRALCRTIVGIAFLAAGGTLLSGGQKEAGDSDLKKIQGTWQFVSHEMKGKKTPPEQVAKLKITFTGDKWSVTEDGKVVQTGTQKLDPTKKPSHVDAVVIDGGVKGVTMLGIYEIKGDTLKVCFDPEGKERPTSFTAKAGLLAEMSREEKKE